MALARGPSSYRTGSLSLHTQTMLALLPLFIPTIQIEVKEEEKGQVEVSVTTAA